MQHTPANRIQRALALAGVMTRRSPRWIEETNSGRLAAMEASRIGLMIK